MKCPVCQARVSRSDEFCANCGTRLGRPIGSVSPPPGRGGGREGVCAHCGAAIDAADIFCPECGNVNTVIVAPGRPSAEREYVFDGVLVPPEEEAPVPRARANADDGPDRPLPDPPPVGLDRGTVSRVFPSAAPPAYLIRFSTGQEAEVVSALVFGRNPRADLAAAGAVLFPLVDPTRSVSKTHGEFSVADGLLSYRDLGSLNGSARLLGGARERLEPQTWVVLGRGDEVAIGDHRFSVGRVGG